MPCTVKCECGKSEKFFQKLNADQIDYFKCDDCPDEAQSSKPSEEDLKWLEEAEKAAKAEADKKAQEKSEKAKAKEAAKKAKDQKPE